MKLRLLLGMFVIGLASACGGDSDGGGGGGGAGGDTVKVTLEEQGGKVSQAHLRYLNPFPRNTGDVLRSYDRVLVPEMNLGQLLKLVRAEFLVDAEGYNRVRGLPFRSDELAEAIEGML